MTIARARRRATPAEQAYDAEYSRRAEVKARRAACRRRRYHADPDFRARHRAAVREYQQRPEVKALRRGYQREWRLKLKARLERQQVSPDPLLPAENGGGLLDAPAVPPPPELERRGAGTEPLPCSEAVPPALILGVEVTGRFPCPPRMLTDLSMAAIRRWPMSELCRAHATQRRREKLGDTWTEEAPR
jgi:hypothetical protein